MLNPTPGGPEGYPYTEKTARYHLGVSKDEMRALRHLHLREREHFVRGKQASVWLNTDAVAALEALAGCPVAGDGKKRAPALIPVEFAPVPDVEVTLLVVNARLKNRFLLLACPADDDPDRPKKTVRVRVQKTVNFERRMEIPARLVAGYNDLYDLNCNCPRKPGKW